MAVGSSTAELVRKAFLLQRSTSVMNEESTYNIASTSFAYIHQTTSYPWTYLDFCKPVIMCRSSLGLCSEPADIVGRNKTIVLVITLQ